MADEAGAAATDEAAPPAQNGTAPRNTHIRDTHIRDTHIRDTHIRDTQILFLTIRAMRISIYAFLSIQTQRYINKSRF